MFNWNLIYALLSRLPFSSLTQTSAFVVIILLLYRLTISGARYDKVVYLKEDRRKLGRSVIENLDFIFLTFFAYNKNWVSPRI